MMSKKTALFFTALWSVFFTTSSFAQAGDSLTLVCTFESGNDYELHFSGTKLKNSELGPLVMYKGNREFQRFDSYLSLANSLRASNSNSYQYNRQLGREGSYQVTNNVEILVDRTTGEIEYIASSGINGVTGGGQKSKGVCHEKTETKLPRKF
ncbi:MAG: hypothetical protein ABJO36_09470 [Litorimonas sp.]